MADKKEKKYLIDNPTLMAEWNWEKNNELGLDPTILTLGSNKKVWWICEKGHEWRSSVANRTKGNGCRKCSNELQTSFPEQAIFFYLKQITEAHNRYLVDGKIEIDIYLPKYNLGIEYDGLRFHQGEKAKQKELKKELILKEKGIRLIRIKESKNISAEEMKDNVIYTSHIYSETNITKMINNLFDRVKLISNIAIFINIDISRDTTKIHEQYIQMQKEK